MQNQKYTITINGQLELNGPGYFSMLKSIAEIERTKNVSQVSIDFKKLSFIRPEGLSILANIVQWLRFRGYQIEFLNVTPTERKWCPIRYLKDCNFFSEFSDIPGSVEKGNLRETTFPFQLVKYTTSSSWEDSLTNWLSKEANKTKDSLFPISLSTQEIFNNIGDHSATEIGCAFAQFFPKEGKIKIAVSDFGLGIPTVLRAHGLLLSSDELSILKAVEKGFTTQSQENNKGLGLENIVGCIVDKGFGEITIVSEMGNVRFFYSNQTQSRNSQCSNNPFRYPGSLFIIELYVNNIPDEESEIQEEMTW